MTKRNDGSMTGQSSGSGLDRRLDNIKESVKGLVDRGEERMDALKDRMMSAKDQAATRGNAMIERTSTFIRANPLKSVGIAFGIGYIGMRLFRR